MDKPISVLIAGSDAVENAELANRITGYEELRVAGIAVDAGAALRLLREREPEVMVLDMGREPRGGVGMLRELRKQELSITPYVLVVADAPTPITCEIARDYGANFIVEKHHRGYSAQWIADFLTVIQDQIRYHISASAVPAENAHQRRKRLVTRIRTELDRVGVSPKLVGYQYLTIGIRIMVEAPTTALYAAIAAEVGKTPACVERAMRNAIILTWNGGDPDSLSAYTARLAPGRTFPTAREFISFYAGKLRPEYE